MVILQIKANDVEKSGESKFLSWLFVPFSNSVNLDACCETHEALSFYCRCAVPWLLQILKKVSKLASWLEIPPPRGLCWNATLFLLKLVAHISTCILTSFYCTYKYPLWSVGLWNPKFVADQSGNVVIENRVVPRITQRQPYCFTEPRGMNRFTFKRPFAFRYVLISIYILVQHGA